MGAAQKYTEHYTVEEWAQWKDRWELIDGLPFCMSPAPSGRHQRISVLIATELTNAIRKKGCRKCKVYHPVDWQISDDTVVEPDLIVLCQPFTGARLFQAPAAVFEILSPSTKKKDRTIKFDLYQSQKVKHYTMVDPETETVEIFTLGPDGQYQKAETGTEFLYTFDDCQVLLDFRMVWED
jgi:Uma2 family endonuclease